jgi:hypothetical protein
MIIEAPPGWLALQPACDDAGTSISPGREPDPIEIDPRPCGLCGLTIDRHDQIDTPEGPEFICADIDPDEMTLNELERREVLRFQEGVAAIMARMEWQASPPLVPPAEAEAYRPAASTISAFWYVVGLSDPEKFKSWLAARPKDAPLLLELLETK